MKTKPAIFLLIATLTLAWSWNALYLSQLSGDGLWVIRQLGMYLTGQLSIALMSVSMILATRPVWLESLFNGMDKIYGLHKWLGITGAGFAIAHWLFKEAGGPISDLVGKTGRPKLAVLPAMQWLHSIAKDLGEWGFYILLIMVALSMWKLIPYHFWRRIHKLIPALYLVLVVHSVALMPASYWASVNGMVMAVLLLSGVSATFIILAKRIGHKRTHVGRVVMIRPHENQTLEVVCDPGPDWRGHTPGQFVFLTFDQDEGAHPFTIASAPKESGTTQLTFHIKDLGDYTAKLAQTLKIDQPVAIEGPYGKFQCNQGRKNALQVWLAAGVGITPFLAWVEALENKTLNRPTSLHYVVTRRDGNHFVSLLEQKCREITNLELHVHETKTKGRFNADTFLSALSQGKAIDLWFCGPSKLANHIHKALKTQGLSNVDIHQELFNFR
ncbi:MAG: ferric reductase [Pusillimonas sp.]|nr:ferric reductase [Pusillimonas sp.]